MVIPDYPPIPVYQSGMSFEDWQKVWQEYWHSDEFKEWKKNIPQVPHKIKSEQTEFPDVGTYPCPVCQIA